MEVREVRDDELKTAGELVVAAYRAIGEGLAIVGHPYEDELRDVGRRARGAVVLVAAEDGRVLGCVTYVPDERSPFAEDLQEGEAGIRMLAVDPGGQRRGVGRMLVEACVERAKADGKQRLFLHSGEWMRAAHRLYGSLGFRRVPERDWEPEPGIPLRAFVLDVGMEGGR